MVKEGQKGSNFAMQTEKFSGIYLNIWNFKELLIERGAFLWGAYSSIVNEVIKTIISLLFIYLFIYSFFKEILHAKKIQIKNTQEDMCLKYLKKSYLFTCVLFKNI